MILVGLTGSLGMGKSTTARMFAEAGVPVWDADAAVHTLYARGGAAVAPVGEAFPGVVRDGAVDREALSAAVLGDDAAMKRLEGIVHPLVSEDRRRFLETAEGNGAAVALIDIPLLFETRREAGVDVIVVATAPESVQRERALARPGLTPEKLDAILARQTPDAEKRARADFIVDTSAGLGPAREQVRHILAVLNDPQFKPRRPLAGPGEAIH